MEDEGTDCVDGDSDTDCGVVRIKRVKLTVKYFFLAEVSLWGSAIDLDQYIFLWHMCFLGCQIRVAWHSGKYGNYTVPSLRH